MTVGLLLLSVALATQGAIDGPGLARTMRELRHEGHAEQALERWRAAPRELRTDPRVAGERIQTLAELGRDAEALRTFRKLTLPDGDPAELAPALAVAVATVRRLQSDRQGARDIVDAILERRASHTDARILSYQLLLDEGRWVEARATLEGLEDGPGARRRAELEADLLAGRARELLGDDARLDETVALLDDATTLAPWRTDVVALRVSALVRWQRLDAAERAAVDALQSAPPGRGTVELRYALGTVYRATERHAEAKACFERVLADDPTHAAARVALARSLSREGRRDEALALLDEILAEGPVHIEALIVKADLAEAEGDMAGAEQALRDVLAQRPNHLKTLWRLSRLLARRGAMEEVDELVARYEKRRKELAEK